MAPIRIGVTARALLLAGSLLCARCGSEPAPAAPESAPAGGPPIHVQEKHSSALVAWRQAEVSERIVVHLDADADVDWLPDETVARIAATLPAEMGSFEEDPHEIDSDPLARFGTGNFLYAASRLGILRELVWVVPSATLDTPSGARRLVQDVLMGRTQMATEDDLRSFRPDGPRWRGTLLGIPITICRLADLPAFTEPVLLDVDLDFFTSPSALLPTAVPTPWIAPREVVAALAARGVRPEIVTISLSSLSGGVPPEARWLAAELYRALRGEAERADDYAARRAEGAKAEAAGEAERATDIYRALTGTREDDATLWYVLARALDASGRDADAAAARARADRLDPLLARAGLLEAERFFASGAWQSALDRYERLGAADDGEEGRYARSRRALCLLRLGREPEALVALKEVVAESPRSSEARSALGALLRDRGELAAALAHLSEARRLAPDVAAHAMELGMAHLVAGRPDAGIRELEEAVARRPCYVQARAKLATAFMRLKRPEEAAPHLRVALALQPANPRFRIMAEQLRKRGVFFPSP